MRARLIGIAAAAAVAITVLPAHSAGPAPQVTDPKGDANGTNQQFPGGPLPAPPETSTPVDVAQADITSVLFRTTFVTKKVKKKKVKVPTAFTVTLTMAAAPSNPVIYRVSSTMAGCETNVFLEYYSSDKSTAARCPSASLGGKETVYDIGDAKISGNSITWTIPVAVIPVGTTFSGLSAQTRGDFVAVTAPQFDYAVSTNTYTVGQ
jgi:hypothetical protein